jgi:TfoX/Sxy family transcriptional regulator of competence genes
VSESKAAAKYGALVKTFKTQAGVTTVTEGKGFGSSGQLKVEGRIFAMLVRDELVLKLPRQRVDELVGEGDGARFDAGKGKPMREWFVLSPTSKKAWARLAREAHDFVKG